jgi:hypothetical protein
MPIGEVKEQEVIKTGLQRAEKGSYIANETF